MGKLRRNSVSVFVIVGAIVIVTNVLLTTHKLDTILPLKFFAKVKKASAMFALIRTKQKPHFMERWKGTNRSLTVVTAFFDIGPFPKGDFNNVRNRVIYERWGSVFQYLQNPLVVFTDNNLTENYFSKIRSNYTESTKIIRISRNDLWPFQIMPRIKMLYSVPGYPKYFPNTHVPEYASLSHSKQPLLDTAATQNVYKTRYFCWLDMGYFREIVRRKKKFWLEVPSDFDEKRIAVTRIFDMPLENITVSTIIYGNYNWIGGGLFLGIPETILQFHKQYKSAVMRYLDQRLMNVEQHILYAMYTTDQRKKFPLEIDVQLYVPGHKQVLGADPWFYLGYLMYNENLKW